LFRISLINKKIKINKNMEFTVTNEDDLLTDFNNSEQGSEQGSDQGSDQGS